MRKECCSITGHLPSEGSVGEGMGEGRKFFLRQRKEREGRAGSKNPRCWF